MSWQVAGKTFAVGGAALSAIWYNVRMKILFVCHGNICRSPMAEFVMKDMLAKAGRPKHA